ncbi:MAG TPA: hypothetical protein VF710_15830 [Longimicrobium sp.]
MLRHAWWVVVYCMLQGCASLPIGGYGNSTSRPALLVERRPWHAGILNPKPPVYGLGKPGGCMVWGEFRVEIDSLSFDPVTHRLNMRVYVDRSGIPRWTGAQLVTRTAAGEPVSKVFVRERALVISADARETPVLTVEGVATRALSLDLVGLSRRVERRRQAPALKRGAT